MGTSQSGWTLLKHSATQLIFGILDSNGTEGFTGTIYIKVLVAHPSHIILALNPTTRSPTHLPLEANGRPKSRRKHMILRHFSYLPMCTGIWTASKTLRRS